MPLYRERAQAVLIKMETVSGVDSVPTAALNAVQMKGVPEIVVDWLEHGDRADVQTGALSGADDTISGGMFGRFDITCEMRPGNLAGPYSTVRRPLLDALWRMSGMSASIDATVGSEYARYQTIDDGMETGTSYVYAGGKLFKLLGCVAQPRLNASVNQVGTITFTVTGVMASGANPTEAAVPGSLDFSANLMPPVWNNTVPAIGTWDSTNADPLMLLAASVNLGNVVSDFPSAGAANGIFAYGITDRSITQELTMYVPQLATWNPYVLAGSAFAYVGTLWQLGNSQYGRVKIRARWKPGPPRLGSRNGRKTYIVNGNVRLGGGLPSGREFEVTYD